MYVNNDKHVNNVDTPLMYLTDYKGVRTMYWSQLPLWENLVLGWDPVLKDFILDSPDLITVTVCLGKILGLVLHSLDTVLFVVHSSRSSLVNHKTWRSWEKVPSHTINRDVVV